MKENQLKLIEDLGLFNIHLQNTSGRHIETNKGQLIDFVSTNYLGFEFEPLLHKRGSEFSEKFGTCAGWSRMELNPKPYSDAENRIAKFLGAEKIHLSHTITITAASLIPGVVKKGTLFTDEKLHTVIWEACRLARDHGANIKKFKHQNMNDLETLLKDPSLPHPKMVCVDGVYSISSEIAPIRDLQLLCEKYGAWLLVDDAHGFGVLGRDPDLQNPLGKDGSGVVSFCGGNYDRTFYMTSFGKAFCTHGAFSVIPNQYLENVKAFSTQYLFSNPISPHALGTIDAVLDLNESLGTLRRKKIFGLTQQMTAGLKSSGTSFLNVLSQPIVFTTIGSFDAFKQAALGFVESGILPGFRAFPVVPPNECGFRFAITALHTEDDIEKVVSIFKSFSRRAA